MPTKRSDTEKNISKYFTEYTNNATIHGIKYIGDREKSLFERICWFTIFCLSFATCVFYIINVWNKWNQFPVITSFNQMPTKIWQIPFPAVTVCPENKIRQTKYNFTYHCDKIERAKEKLTETEIKRFVDVSELCGKNCFVFDSVYHNTVNSTFIKSLMELSTPRHQIFTGCLWYSNNRDVCAEFSPTITDYGLCYTFNMLDRSEIFKDIVDFIDSDYVRHKQTTEEWSPDDYLKKTVSEDTYPRRSTRQGTGSGLFFEMVAIKKDLDYHCGIIPQGYHIILHHPSEYPSSESLRYRVSFNQQNEFVIRPDIMTTSPGLKGHHPHTRKCYFSNERPLKFFKIYTKQNCYLECLANYTLQICGCVSRHLPRDNSSKICGLGSSDCVEKAEDAVINKETESEIFDYVSPGQDNDSLPYCNCLPSCTSVKYNAEVSQTGYDWNKFREAYGLNEPSDLEYFTTLHIYFRDSEFISTERRELFGTTEFWANSGGLLGLFIGFSLISFLEAIYFIFIRLLCNVRTCTNKL